MQYDQYNFLIYTGIRVYLSTVLTERKKGFPNKYSRFLLITSPSFPHMRNILSENDSNAEKCSYHLVVASTRMKRGDYGLKTVDGWQKFDRAVIDRIMIDYFLRSPCHNECDAHVTLCKKQFTSRVGTKKWSRRLLSWRPERISGFSPFRHG